MFTIMPLPRQEVYKTSFEREVEEMMATRDVVALPREPLWRRLWRRREERLGNGDCAACPA